MSGYNFMVGGNNFKVTRDSFTVTTENTFQAIDVSDQIKKFVSRIKMKEGIILCFNRHSTASIVVCNKRDDVANDIVSILRNVISSDLMSELNIKRGVDTMRAYFGASIFGNSICMPIIDSKLGIGEWQAVYLLEFNGPREREISLLAVGSE